MQDDNLAPTESMVPLQRPSQEDVSQRRSEREEQRRLSEDFGNMEFEADLYSKGFLDPLSRLGLDAEAAKTVPGNFNVAGLQAREVGGSNTVQSMQANRESLGYTSPIERGDVLTVGDFSGSNTVWTHEFRHRGLEKLLQGFDNDPNSFIEQYLPGADEDTKLVAELVFNGREEELLVDYMDRRSPEELGFDTGVLSDDSESLNERYVQPLSRVEEAIMQAAQDRLIEEGSPPPATMREKPETGWLSGLFQNIFGRNKFAEGGVVSMEEQMSLFDMGGLTDDGAMRDPVSGNEVPPGSMASEVRDDVPAMLSEGEYIVPADVVRYYGVKFFEDLRGQAKSGMMDMERNGRIGGEPVGAPEDDLTPEELQMLAEITGMYSGGMVRKGYQQGGMVNRPFTPVPNYTTPGFSLFQPMQPAAPTTPAEVPQTETVTLYGPNGEIVTLTLPTDQERYNALIGQGYSTQQQVRQPTVQGGESDSDGAAPGVAPTAPGLGADAQRDFTPLDPDEYNAFLTDPLKFGSEALQGKDFTRLFGGAGNLILGPVGGLIGGAVGAGMTAQNVAQARAASQIAKAKGLDTTALDAQIQSYISGLPNLSRVSSDLLTSGDRIAERFFQTARDMGLPESQYGKNPLTRDFFATDEAFEEELQKTAPEGMVYDPTVGAGTPSLTYNEQTKKFEDRGETLPGGGYVRPESESAAPTTPTVRPVQRPTTRPDGTPVPPPATTTPAPSTPPPSDDRDDDRDSGTDTNVGNYGGDRDGDGVPNWRDFNDGSGWADNNKDESKDTSGACFLTTAVVEMRGEEDDGYTLSTLRRFRDTYLKNKNNEVEKYYEVAPKLVKAIPKEDKTWLWIGKRVDKAIEYIEMGKNGLAYQTYKRMVEKLERDWLKEK